MNENMRKLSEDIIRENIIPYTYECQKKELLDDIKDYIKIKGILKRKYEDMYNITSTGRGWLLNDLIRFFNNDMANENGYHEDYFRKYKRLYKFKEKGAYDLCFTVFMRIPLFDWTRSINTKIGILTCEERKLFLKFIEGL